MATYQDTLKKITQESQTSGNSTAYASEIARANQVIADRKKRGLDTAAQDKYIRELNQANSLGQVKRQAQGAGADPNNVSADYVTAKATGTMQNYNNNLNTAKASTTASMNIPQSTPGYAAPPTQTYTAASAPAPVSSVPQVDIAAQMEKLKQAQLQASMSGLDKQRTGALSNLTAEKATIKPQYYDARNQANVTMNNQKRSFSDFLAQRGLSSSGVAAQGTMNNLNQYQGNLGTLGRQEQAAYDDIGRRTTDVENNYLSDVEGARAGVESQYLQNYINQANADRNFNRGAMESDRSFGIQQGQFDLQQKEFDLKSESYGIESEMNRIKLEMMKNPNSPENQMNSIKLQQMQFELQQAQELAKYAPEEAKLKIQQIKAQISATNRSNQPAARDPLDDEYRKAQIEALKNKNTDNTGLTQQQVTSYNNLLSQYSRQGRDPVEAYNYAASPQGKLNAINYGVTEGLYSQMLADLKSRVPQQKTNSYKTDPDFAANVQGITTGKISREDVVSNSEQLINDYTYDGYLQLLKLAEG